VVEELGVEGFTEMKAVKQAAKPEMKPQASSDDLPAALLPHLALGVDALGLPDPLARVGGGKG
jgi:hypothetical protein